MASHRKLNIRNTKMRLEKIIALLEDLRRDVEVHQMAGGLYPNTYKDLEAGAERAVYSLSIAVAFVSNAARVPSRRKH